MIDLTKRISGLDAMRGIAALIVVFNHYQVILSPALYSADIMKYTPARWLIDGRISVILFFVLSGFVLAAPIVSGKFQTYSSFLIRRFTRIYLPFLFSILGAASLWWIVTSIYPDTQFEWNEWRRDISWGMLLSHIFASGAKDTAILNPPIWTLIFELRMAIIFPLLVWLVRKGSFLTVICSVVFAYLASKAFKSVDGGDNMYYSDTILGGLLLTIYYAQFFVFGIFIATKIDWIKSIMVRFPEKMHYGVIALMFLIPSALFDGQYIIHELWYALMAIYLVVCCVLYTAMNQSLMVAPLQWLGKVSFSLYLIHMPIIYAMIYVLLPYMPLWAIALLSFPVILVLAEVMHNYIEIPSMLLGKKWTSNESKKNDPSVQR